MVGARFDGVTVGLRAVDGVIAELGADVVAAPGDEVVDGTGLALLPGLVNGHTHAAMTLFRGYGGDLPLMEWLQTRIWPAEARLDDDDVYWGTRLACLEMIRSGTSGSGTCTGTRAPWRAPSCGIHRQHITRLAGWIVPGCTVDGAHYAVGEGLGVELSSSLGIIIVPETNRVFCHCVSFPLVMPHSSSEIDSPVDLLKPRCPLLSHH